MVIGIIGENCVGKSTLATEIQKAIGAEIITGKDYLRMAKSEGEATALFQKKLEKAVTGENILYIISEKEQISFLPQSAIRVLVTADLETIKERFKTRMRGNLPKPVEQMLEKKHGMFDAGNYDFYFDSTEDEGTELCQKIKNRVQE